MKFEKHIYLHIYNHGNPDFERKVLKKLKKIMAKQEEFNALIERLNVATNDIAADITRIKEQLESGTISQESIDELGTIATRLEDIGASTENPVPEPPVE